MIPMTTFYDPATIRRLAATGDAFYRGAAWILDQQDAARIDTTDYDAEWKRNVVALNPHTEEYRRLQEISAAMPERMELVRNAHPTPNAADLGAPRIG